MNDFARNCCISNFKFGLNCSLFWLVSTEPVRFGTVRYGTQLCQFPLSEVVNGTKIANRTVTLFWYPSVGVSSTTKCTKRVELNSLQNFNWLTNRHFCVIQEDKASPSLVRSALCLCHEM